MRRNIRLKLTSEPDESLCWRKWTTEPKEGSAGREEEGEADQGWVCFVVEWASLLHAFKVHFQPLFRTFLQSGCRPTQYILYNYFVLCFFSPFLKCIPAGGILRRNATL